MTMWRTPINFWARTNETITKCSTCQCLIDMQDAHKVEVFSAFSGRRQHYYCKRCKPAFDEVVYDDICKATYYSRVQVEKDGTPVGYKKVKNK